MSKSYTGSYASVAWNGKPHVPATGTGLGSNRRGTLGNRLQDNRAAGSSECIQWRYRPSDWELTWHQLVQHPSLASLHPNWRYALRGGRLRSGIWPAGCAALNGSAVRRQTSRWMQLARARTRGRKTCEQLNSVVPRDPERSVWADISYHSVFNRCTGVEIARVPIEPLVGFLRNPDFMRIYCLVDSKAFVFITDKHYLMPMHRCELQPRDAGTRAPRFLMFDLGASLWKSGPGGASQEWFIQTYGTLNITFDRIFAWEATPHTPEEIYKDVPQAMRRVLTYHNVPVDPAPGATHNPLRLLKEEAGPDDFVVFKIDIDTIPIEIALLEQILADPDASRLIDELYFEDHVINSPMMEKGWIYTIRAKENNATTRLLSDSYDSFRRLREMGIRAHSWV